MAGRNKSDVSSAFAAVAIDYSGGDQTVSGVARGIYVGVTGNVKVDMPGASGITFSNLPVGFAPIQVTKVYQTGSTITSSLLLF